MIISDNDRYDLPIADPIPCRRSQVLRRAWGPAACRRRIRRRRRRPRAAYGTQAGDKAQSIDRNNI